jgi:8-oxo-dGTP pyrophosphatase MutT (NUDIX family)
MQTVYALEPLPTKFRKTLFLAGPTPRNNGRNATSWRPEALRLLEELGYDGVVFVPEDRSGEFHGDYIGQVDWEHQARAMADVIVFWVPREIETMPGFTTNVEFGLDAAGGKAILGAPPDAPKLNYLRHTATMTHYQIPHFDNLPDTLAAAVKRLGEGALRTDGECQVPLAVWETASFQNWYQAQRGAGNRLDGARVEWSFYTTHGRNLFCWALHVDVYVAREDRNKVNEVIIGRPDVVMVVLYGGHRMYEQVETPIVLVREFRSTASTADGYIYDLPGGSTWKVGPTPLEIAVEELFEETGFAIAPERLRDLGKAQLAGTFATHQATVFAAQITNDEVQLFRDQAGIVHGNEGDSERTYVEVVTLGAVGNYVDWSTYGMIARAVKG